ncbi:MAG: hypothetical protein H8D80_00285 [Proteobacteria bacterium]|nr:hypothetical protein [Pseudomonadota bacterium]
MSKKRNRHREYYDEDRRTAENQRRKSRKKNKTSKRSREKDYLKDMLEGNIDPDAYQEHTDNQY